MRASSWLLSLASELMEMGRPARGEDRLDSLLTLLIKGGRNRETTALLAVMGELLVDDLAAQSRCRR